MERNNNNSSNNNEDLDKIIYQLYRAYGTGALERLLKGSWGESTQDTTKQTESVTRASRAHRTDTSNNEHYKVTDREAIDEMLLLFGRSAVISFCRLNVYKYRYRAEHKGQKQSDLDKAEWYLDYLEDLEAESDSNDGYLF